MQVELAVGMSKLLWLHY